MYRLYLVQINVLFNKIGKILNKVIFKNNLFKNILLFF
jgi:hypothetical protein